MLHYVADREADGDAWVAAMEGAGVPLAFIWGPSDPVSGEQVIAEVERRLPRAAVTRLPGGGHWLSIEDPDASPPPSSTT